MLFRSYSFLLIFAISLIMPISSKAAIIFQDNFDTSPDWSSQQTVHKSVGGQDRGWPLTYKNACTLTCPPQNWTAYRTNASHFTDTPGNDTYILSSAGARGNGGKGITLNVESTSGYNDWAGGSIDLWLGEVGFHELYVRYWLKYDSNWTWTNSESTVHGQQKLIRISRFNADINQYYNHNPQEFFRPTENGPSWMPDWYYNKEDKTGIADFQSAEFYNVQLDGALTYGPTPVITSFNWPSDSQWHLYEFRVKMNSAPGVADGHWEFWIDGQEDESRHALKTNVPWVDATGSTANGWNYLMFWDNITVAPEPVSAKKEMQIYADDVVVSDSRLPVDYVIDSNNTDIISPSAPTGLNII